MIALFIVFAIHGYITFDLNLKELQNSIELKNKAQANSIMQNLDKYIKNRIDDVSSITKSDQVQEAIIISNKKIPGKSMLNESRDTPFISDSNIAIQNGDFSNMIDFYKQEYQYDISQKMYVTNQYGAVITLNGDTSNIVHNNDVWWKSAKKDGIYFGEIQFDNNSNSYYVPLALKITDDQSNFIGVIKVLFNLDILLRDFEIDSAILKESGNNLILLDYSGRMIYSEGIKYNSESESVKFYKQLVGDNGFFEITNETQDPTLVAYSRSNGYGVFAGSNWSVLVEQSQSSISSQFINARNSVLLISAIGIIVSVIIGIFVSISIAKPLLNLSRITKRLSNGDFSVRVQKSRLYEIEVIGQSFNNMTESLKKLVDTEIKLTEAHVQIKNERLTAIGELAASLAHNLKNPLATIQSSADIIRREYKGSDREIMDVISRMNRAIDRMTHQIDDVLNFVRTTPLNLDESSLTLILNSVIKNTPNSANVKIELPENDVKLICDTRKFEIVLSNLVLNAIEAIGNQKNGMIKISAKDEPSQIIIEIQDNGPGISNELLPRLFEPLVTSKLRGTGLGLSSCKNIIEQHGGTISVTNNPTTFVITLSKRTLNSNTA